MRVFDATAQFLRGLVVKNQATPARPPTGNLAFYAKADGDIYVLDSNGVERTLVTTTSNTSLYDLRLPLEALLLEMRMHTEQLASLTGEDFIEDGTSLVPIVSSIDGGASA